MTRLVRDHAFRLVLLLLALLAVRQVGSPDAGFHLRSGEDISLRNRGWPRHDTYTLSVSDHAYIDTAWGYDVILAAIASAFGVGGLTVFHAFLVVFAFGLVARTTNDPGATGRFSSGTNALHLVFVGSGTSTVLDGTRSGNQVSGTYTVTQNSAPVDSGTFKMSFVMHPADLDTGNSQNAYVSRFGGFTYLDFSTPYLWVNATDNYDAGVYWDDVNSKFIIYPFTAPSPGVPVAFLFPGTVVANWYDFYVRATAGGPLDADLGAFTLGVPIENVNQLFFLKTRENRFAMVWVESLVPGSSVNLRSIYGYGGYAFNGTPPNGQTYVQRRKTGTTGPVTHRFFMELRDPDTNLPVDPNRLDTTSFRVAASNFAGTQMPVKSGTEEAYDAT